MLRKEQAMAYARGLVAGFEMDNIDEKWIGIRIYFYIRIGIKIGFSA